MELLKNKMIDSNHLNEDDKFDNDVLCQMLKERFEVIDFENAKLDVERFLHKDKSILELFSKETFIQLTEDYFRKLK